MKLSKIYEPGKTEGDIYKLWESSGSFSPSQEGAPYSIIMPPPNANAPLHIGHALFAAIQDLLIRYQRLKGGSALYLPGADHAGFETWVVYEKKLAKEGKSRFDFTREELYKQVYDFVENNKDTMLSQLKSLGVSADWSRFTYTLDERVISTTYSTFKKLWDDKLIYRGERLVNYCTKHGTSFADIEVEYIEQNSPLYYIKYGPFTLATTRPETKFGDTAVAVHPDDERYKKYVDTVIKAEGVNGTFELRVVADSMVDPNFGTGAVKMTPAHDFNDWEVGQRHNLEAIRVINHDGTMNHRAGKYEGMTVAEARKAVAKALKEKGLLEKVDEKYKNRIGVCYKCKTPIEPMLMDQWFVNIQPLAKAAINAINNDEIAFVPANKKEHAIRYLENVKDWNISRQIAWGIPIPAFQNVDDEDDWIFSDEVNKEIIEFKGKNYRRDPDVFDTWFSSGQWPFITLGYPEETDYKKFYPTSVMETGGEIFNQWVLRMIMLGLYVTDKVPFKTVYIHGYVQAEDGTKMSKSLGNVINPMEVVDKFGSDALRMGLLQGRVAGVASAYSQDKVIGARNFANKLWNIARYVEGVIGDDYEPNEPKTAHPADDWVLDRLNEGVKDITKQLDDYRFAEAYETLYHFVWDDFADWYIEVSKTHTNKDVLAHALRSILTLAHPFAPFVTETIWQTLQWTDGLAMTSAWPQTAGFSKGAAKDFEQIKLIVAEIRDLKASLALRETTLYHRGDQVVETNQDLIIRLSGISEIKKVKDGFGLHLISSGVDAWIDVEHDRVKDYVSDLNKQINDGLARQKQLRARLENKKYLSSAPKELVQQTKDEHQELEQTLKRLRSQLSNAQGSLEKG